ncbi:hypothetical protein B4N89_21115 [Embleya scabrispora]|uniref:Uncharacterized protein n=1 Tax=Embleya scabrispora TaxID=159449 RepID=A0A1T3P1Y3_9ACTN|nr:hypothetical protein [Embleya scabrispora]OPC83103.1 hypothetical protein B4N89_21115 [Embleya scabrispora]
MSGTGARFLRDAWHGASRVDAVRVLAGAALAGSATIVLLCLLAWARPSGRAAPAPTGPLLAALPVLAAVAVLTAVGTRLAILHRHDRADRARHARAAIAEGPPAAGHGAGHARGRGAVATEAAITALVGTIAGMQAHLLLRSVRDSVPPAVRRLLVVGAEVHWPGLVALLVVVPTIAAIAAASAVRGPSPRSSPRVAPYVGPLLVLAGLLAQYLIADPARPEQLPHGALPAAVAGYAAVLIGAALTVPWLVAWIGGGWASRAGRVWTLCAARRMEAGAHGLALPLGLTTIALAVVTTGRLAGERTPVRMADAPLFLTVATVSLCAAAMLFAVVIEYGPARRETSRTLHTIGAATPTDRRAALVALAVPVLVCVPTAITVGALAAWPAHEGANPFPTVSTHAALLGTVWAVGLPAAALIAAAAVILRDERPRRRRRA